MRSRAGEIVVVPVGACTGVAAPRRLHDDGGDIPSAKRRQCRIQALPDTLRLRPTTVFGVGRHDSVVLMSTSVQSSGSAHDRDAKELRHDANATARIDARVSGGSLLVAG